MFHELLLNAMKASANIDDNFPQSKASRSRSGSSADSNLKLQHQPRPTMNNPDEIDGYIQMA